MVTTDGMDTSVATARLYARAAPGALWRSASPPFPATLGRSGLGWAWDHTTLADGDEPVKREGDGRTPAGVFAAGAAFGFRPRPVAGYRRIEEGAACVDDPRSPHYNVVLDVARVAPAHSVERMWQVPLYRQGIFVRHATNRALAGGSCIFIHVWRAPARPTAGCIAMAEERVIALQDAFGGMPAAILVMPEDALGRLSGCLPPS